MSVESEKREEKERRILYRKTTAGREERGKDIGRGREEEEEEIETRPWRTSRRPK